MGNTRKPGKIKYGILWIMVLIMALGMLAACNPIGTTKVVSKKFVSSSVITTGGDKSLETGINLKNIAAEASGEEIQLTLSFVKGSRLANENTGEAAVMSVPEYSIKVLEDPHRMQISIHGLNYWDYSDDVLSKASGLIYGGFSQMPMGDEPFSLFLQLNSDVEYSVQEKDSQLILTLKAKEQEAEANKVYVLLNAYDEYSEGLIPEDLGFTPTLCDENGAANVAIISKAFSTSKEAEEFRDQVNEALKATMPTKTAYVQELKTDALPTFDAGTDLAQVEKHPVLYSSNKENVLPLVMQNATYACSAPNGNMLFIRTSSPDASLDVEMVTTDALWIVEPTGKKEQLDITQPFYGIAAAAYSKDGQYLAILDITQDQSLLYVYNTQNGELYNLAEEGFGSVTSGFVWDGSENILYGMTGFDKLQLMQYDLTDGTGKISTVEEQEGFAGNIGIAGEKLYFAAQNEGEKGTVYAVDTTQHTREKLTEGISFAISPDGKYMALCRPRPIVDEVQYVDVVLFNLETKEEKIIMENIVLEKLSFSADSSHIYFTYGLDAPEKEAYPYALVDYAIGSGKLNTVGNLTTPVVMTGTYGNSLFITDNMEVEGTYTPNTYRYDIQ